MSIPNAACTTKRMSVALVSSCLALLSAPAHAQKLDVRYGGTQTYEFNGWSVSSGFDCDGDGIADVAVGAPFEDGAQSDEGVVRVYSGATHALLQTIIVGGLGSNAGWSVALVGDVDGDGYGDVVVGAPFANGGGGFVGAYSVHANSLLWYIYGGTGEELGRAVAAAGDVDHDGHMDVIAGAPGGNNVYLYGWGTGALHVWHSSQANAQFGKSVSGNVDVDGDGTPDVIIGAPTYSTAFPFSVDRGRVDVYSGVNYGLLMSKLGDHAGDELGYSVCGLGDVNGDGKAEVLAGAPYDATNGNNAGLVRKFDSSGVTLVSLYGPGADDNYGISLAKVPDVDGDGIPEYAIGTEAVNNNGYVELREGDDDTLLWTYLPPDSSYTDYGFAVAGGDVNGDGVGDVVVGAPTRTVSGVVGAGSADVWLNINAKTTGYGAGYPGTLGIPDLSGLSDPGIGTTFVAGVTNSRGAATTGLVIVGFSRLNVPTSAGGTLLVAPFEIVPISIPATGVLLSGSLPNDPALIGVVVDLQVLEFDPGAGHRLSFTPGLELLIGVDYP